MYLAVKSAFRLKDDRLIRDLGLVNLSDCLMHRYNDGWVLEEEKSQAVVISTLGLPVSYVHKRPRLEKSVKKGQVGISFTLKVLVRGSKS